METCWSWWGRRGHLFSQGILYTKANAATCKCLHGLALGCWAGLQEIWHVLHGCCRLHVGNATCERPAAPPGDEEQEGSTSAGALGFVSQAMLGWNRRASPDKVKLLPRSARKMLLQNIFWVCLLGQLQPTGFLSLSFCFVPPPFPPAATLLCNNLPPTKRACAPPLQTSVFPPSRGANARCSHQVSGVC